MTSKDLALLNLQAALDATMTHLAESQKELTKTKTELNILANYSAGRLISVQSKKAAIELAIQIVERIENENITSSRAAQRWPWCVDETK